MSRNQGCGVTLKHFSSPIVIVLLVMTLIVICFVSPTTAADKVLNVHVVNYPLKYFAERIGGDHVTVTLPVPPGEDPVYWNPGIADIGAYQKADLILLNGAGYAKWVTKVSLPRAKTVDTSKAFQERYITVTKVTTHSHGAEGEHAHEGLAFTTWLDLSLAARQAEAVYRALARRRPALEAQFKANALALTTELLALHDRILKIVSEGRSTPILVSHPVYDYFIRAYGLNARALHFEPHQRPTENQMSALEKELSDHPARWMLWEDQPTETAVARLHAVDIGSAVFNPCGNAPRAGDFMSVMEQNVNNLAAVFQ